MRKKEEELKRKTTELGKKDTDVATLSKSLILKCGNIHYTSTSSYSKYVQTPNSTLFHSITSIF